VLSNTYTNHQICIVGFYAREDLGGGIPRYTISTLRNIRRLHPDIRLVFVEFGNNPNNVTMRWLKRVSYTLKVASIKAEVYHAVTGALALPLLLARKRPIVVTIHDLFPLYPDLYKASKVELELMRKVLHASDMLIATAEYWKRDLVKYFKISEDKVVVIPVGVDHEKFKPVKVYKDMDKKIILYVGALTWEKGLDLLLHAFKYVVKKVPNAYLYVGGKGPLDQYFRGLAIRLGIARHVRFLGFIPEDKLPYYYSSADVFCYPSRTAFGLMLLEAMACGIPVVAVDRFQVREYVGDAGILVSPNDIVELAKALVKVLTNNNLREELSMKAFKRARRFDWRTTAKLTLDAYVKLKPMLMLY